MEDIQIELRKWLSNHCGNVQKYEDRVRTLIRQDKNLIRDINTTYSSRDIVSIQKRIEGFLKEEQVFIKTCKKCKKVTYISGPYKPDEIISDRKCKKCSHWLFGKKAEPQEFKEKVDSTLVIKKCLYCNNPVLPPNTVTCYSHNNVSFEY
ncbi:hypothetical protein [Sporosarcina sp. BP05]|uniref:hypothetical protein n=1 Tax=Sporosarcina sp. BP05 TaxID=2758726 RepID=UPI00164594C7|nr:hypothetical protein [Sporosarcina sp. BP05]